MSYSSERQHASSRNSRQSRSPNRHFDRQRQEHRSDYHNSRQRSDSVESWGGPDPYNSTLAEKRERRQHEARRSQTYDRHRNYSPSRNDRNRYRGSNRGRSNFRGNVGGRRGDPTTDAFYADRVRQRKEIPEPNIWAESPPPPISRPAQKSTKSESRHGSRSRSVISGSSNSDKSRSRSRSRSLSDSDNSSSSDSSIRHRRHRKKSRKEKKRHRSRSSRKHKRRRHHRSPSSDSDSEKEKRRRRHKSRKSKRARKRSPSTSSDVSNVSCHHSPSEQQETVISSDQQQQQQSQEDFIKSDTTHPSMTENRPEGTSTAQVSSAPDDSESDDDIGPQPTDAQVETAKSGSKMHYGGALRPGEGAAIAGYVQQNKRIPRRGEIGLTGEEIDDLEAIGYVMSGSRHARMNAIRIRKENQVYSAEEKRALALYNYEEQQKKEQELMNNFKSMLEDRGMGPNTQPEDSQENGKKDA